MKTDSEQIEELKAKDHILDPISADQVYLGVQSSGGDRKKSWNKLREKVRRPSLKMSILNAADQARATSIFKFATTENSTLFDVNDDVVDPLE